MLNHSDVTYMDDLRMEYDVFEGGGSIGDVCWCSEESLGGATWAGFKSGTFGILPQNCQTFQIGIKIPMLPRECGILKHSLGTSTHGYQEVSLV